MSGQYFFKLRHHRGSIELRNHKEIEQLLIFLSKKEEDIHQIESCYLVAENLKEAHLFVVFCFGGLQAIDKLPQVVPQRVKDNLKKQLSKFEWNPKVHFFQMFQKNAKLFGDLYPIIKKQVINKLDKEQSLELFIWVKQTYLLHGVKIRNWKFSQYDENKRKHQQIQLNRGNETRYLILIKTKEASYYVGAIYFHQEIKSFLQSLSWNSQNPRQKQALQQKEQIKFSQSGQQNSPTKASSNSNQKSKQKMSKSSISNINPVSTIVREVRCPSTDSPKKLRSNEQQISNRPLKTSFSVKPNGSLLSENYQQPVEQSKWKCCCCSLI